MKTGTDKMLCLLGFKCQGDLGAITCYTSKRDRVVWFIKAPPLEPPSDSQKYNRGTFKYIALEWWSLNAAQRQAWKDACHKAHLRIGGYALFTYWWRTSDDAAIATISHQSGVELPPPP